MKKFLSLTLALAMLGTALTGCSSKDAASLTSAESTQQTAPVRQEQSQAEKALALINTFATGDTDTARSLLSDGYIQHNLAYGTGAGEQVAFDIFRFDKEGKIAEHWDNLAAKGAPNPSGRTQIDGSNQLADLDQTENNRKIVEDFLYDVMQGHRPEKTASYFAGDTYIQHNTAIADGLSGLGAALEAMAKQGIEMIYNKTHQVLAQGNFVLAVSEGTFGGAPTSYYDLWRLEKGKIAEHWDVMETIADQSTWQNQNGKF